MGRHAKPINLHVAEGNPNRLTKAQIVARQDSEVKLGGQDIAKLKPPLFVKNDPSSSALWKRLIKEYVNAANQGVELLTSSDIETLGLYCKTYSEYERLQNMHNEMAGAFDRYAGKSLDALLSASESLVKVETAINKKMDMLLKLQDRLFLNPLAKVKNVPKPKKEDTKVVSKFAKFGGGNRA